MDSPTRQTTLLRKQAAEQTFVLTELHLYNWGSFAGRHTAHFDLEGTAIIGPTGSGKTTLVDALMTLIAQNPRYNLASTGGQQSDRELVSYIRGVSGAGNRSGDNEHIARSGKTVSAISARFANATEQVTVGAVFAIDGTSSALSDVKRWWIFSQAPGQGLDEWLTAHHEGGGRALKQLSRDVQGLYVYDTSKNAYLAQLRRFFDVGENAFALLNRAAGLKQIDSIDEIFRELVLDDNAAFDRAAEVARQFDDLAAIHAELETARLQRDALQPVASTWETRQQVLESLTRQRALQTALPIWYAGHAHRLWTQQLADVEEKLRGCASRESEVTEAIKAAESQATALRDIYLQAGGASIEQLRELIAKSEQIVQERARYAADYRRIAERLALDSTLTVDALLANQHHAKEKHHAQVELCAQLSKAAWEAGAAEQARRKEQAELRQQLAEIKSRPGSNIPFHYHQFRALLAQQLRLREDELPYAAELIEVMPNESRWRGAIERAVGAHRLRILVPANAMDDAARWVNYRDNRLNVRLQEVSAEHAPVRFFDDSYVHKLNFKAHRAVDALKRLLSSIDRHCLSSPEALRGTPFGLTEQGMMSGKNGLLDKLDQAPLDKDWMTGFDNKARVAELERSLAEADEALSASQKQHEAARKAADQAKTVQGLLETLMQIEFATIDLPGAQRDLQNLQERMQALTAPGSDAQDAHARWIAANDAVSSLRAKASSITGEKAKLEEQRDRARSEQAKAFRRTGEGLTDAQQTLAAESLTAPVLAQIEDLPEIERRAAADVESKVTAESSRLAATEKILVRTMGEAKKVDTGALSEAGTDIHDIEKYLERLRVLTEEALPEKLDRFQKYLNQSSDQGVTRLLSDIDNHVSMIEERIDDLNATLRRVDFQPERYLRLQPVRVTHDSLRDLQQAQRHLRSAVLKDDQGESHFRALRHVVELLRTASDKKTTMAARALLDPRYRLHFEVSVIERDTGAVVEIRTGSQGGSGGEKEIIASYVLTASLSYALSEGGKEPLFGTVVLDEAFSKSSHAVASRIISALAEFGLRPLFVTPNKELRLLREHTRSAILVHRKGQRATLTSLSWEELEEHAERRKASQAT